MTGLARGDGGMTRLWVIPLALLGALSCAEPESATSVDVLLVTIDTLRADALSASGRERGTTPNLDALAAAGTRFTDATTVTPLTLPAHASILTGIRPARHGLTVNGVASNELPVPTLAEALLAQGYATGAFVSASVLDEQHGLSAGFQTYDDGLFYPGGPPRPQERRADRTIDSALQWMAEHEGAPWMAWVHLFDPHAPYAAPDKQADPETWPALEGGAEDLSQNRREDYLDEVRWVDSQLGRLLSTLRQSRHAAHQPSRPLLVIVTSDHGESLGEHGESTHGVLMYQGAMHVPLIVAWLDPESPLPAQGRAFPAGGQVRDDVVSVLDVTPTVLDLLGLPVDAELDGRSLSEPRPQRIIPLECRSPAFYYGFSPLVGLRRGAEKLMGAPQSDPEGWRLYDLAVDAAEQTGVDAQTHPLRTRVLSPEPEREASVVTDLETLRALGYVGATIPDSSGSDRRDPRTAMDLVDAIDAANSLLVAQAPADALERLATLPDEYDSVPELHFFRGKALRALGRPQEAAHEFSEAHLLQPSSGGTLVEWGRALLEVALASRGSEPASSSGGPPIGALRTAEEASRLFQKALSLVPGDPEAIAMWALTEIEFGKAEEALERIKEALGSRPQAVNLMLVQRRALQVLGRDKEAADVTARLQQLSPNLR